MDGAPVLRHFISFLKINDFITKQMISFITGTLLKEELCCKFMLKQNVKNYFGQFTKTLSICFL